MLTDSQCALAECYHDVIYVMPASEYYDVAAQQIQQELKNQNEKASGKLIPEAFLVGYIAKTT